MEINFDVSKLLIVEIDKVRPNSWNPKDKDTEEYKKVRKSIETNGLRLPIVVREDNGYEIIDGEQRWRSCKDLGYEKVIIYNEGNISDKEAKELTIWYQQQVPFNEVELASLVSGMFKDYGEVKTPFTENELDEMKKLVDFNWDKFNKTETSMLPDDTQKFKTFSVTLTEEQYDVVIGAINKIKDEDGEITDSRAIELICADYLAGK